MAVLNPAIRKRFIKLLVGHDKELLTPREEKELEHLSQLWDLAEVDPPPLELIRTITIM